MPTSTDYRTLTLAPDPSSHGDITATSPAAPRGLAVATPLGTVGNLTGLKPPPRLAFTISAPAGTRAVLVPGNHAMATAILAADHAVKFSPVIFPGIYHGIAPAQLGTVNIAGIPITGQLWPRGAPRLY